MRGQLSQARAVATRTGHFDAEIVPVPRRTGPVRRTTARAPAPPWSGSPSSSPSSARGPVTAGNACPLNDGAAAVLVMSDEGARDSASSRAPASSPPPWPPPPRVHGPRADPSRPQRARQGGHDDRRHRHRRAQRGVRRPGPPCPTSRTSPARSSTRRRRHRPRSPVRDDRRTDHDDAAQRAATRHRTSGSRPCASPAAWARR